MRAFLAILCGFAFTLAVFGSGLAVATWFLAAEPVQPTNTSLDVSGLWAREPRNVNSAAQDLQRLPARSDPKAAQQAKSARAAADPPAPPAQTEATGAAPPDAAAPDAAPIDSTTTGSVEAAPRDEQPPPERAELIVAHLEWCARRYRSYQPQDNSYRPYRGGRRPCISPHLVAAAATEGEEIVDPDAAPLASDTFAAEVPVAEIPDDEGDAGFAPEFGYASDESAEFEVTPDHVAYCFSRYRSYRPEDNTYQPYGGGPRRQCE